MQEHTTVIPGINTYVLHNLVSASPDFGRFSSIRSLRWRNLRTNLNKLTCPQFIYPRVLQCWAPGVISGICSIRCVVPPYRYRILIYHTETKVNKWTIFNLRSSTLVSMMAWQPIVTRSRRGSVFASALWYHFYLSDQAPFITVRLSTYLILIQPFDD